MSKRRQERSAPRKLTEFFPTPNRQSFRDGARGHTEATYINLRQSHQDGSAQGGTTGGPQFPETSSAASTPSSSPAKSKMKLTPEAEIQNEGNPLPRPPQEQISFSNSIATYPTSNQPVLDTTLRDMLMTLQSSIHSDITNML